MEDEKALANAGSNVELVTLESIETRMAVAWENVARNYLEVGRLLCEAKDRKLVPHGKWETWVAENAHMSERQAQKLMQMARAVPQGSALAQLPSSKVQAILALPESAREDMAQRALDENMTVRKLKEQIDELQEQVTEARQSERKMAQSVQQADDMRARLYADRKQLEDDRYKMIQQQRAWRAEVERLKSALKAAEQRSNDNSVSPEAQRQIDALRAELTEAEAQAERQAAKRQAMEEQLLAYQREEAHGVDMAESSSFGSSELGAAVAAFIGAAGVLPHMGATLAETGETERRKLLGYVEQVSAWVEGCRKALGTMQAHVEIK